MAMLRQERSSADRSSQCNSTVPRVAFAIADVTRDQEAPATRAYRREDNDEQDAVHDF